MSYLYTTVGNQIKKGDKFIMAAKKTAMKAKPKKKK